MNDRMALAAALRRPAITMGVCALALWSQGPLALDKPIVDLPAAASSLTPGQQLQDAVNNPANAGVILRLARGSYVLDPTRPAGGRLILQPGMEIVGENEYVDCDADGVWDPVLVCNGGASSSAQFTLDDSETLIDGSAITVAETMQADAPPQRATAVVRLGRDNTLRQVTVRAPRNVNVGGSVDVNVLPEAGGMSAVVADNVLEGGQRGIRCNNGPLARSGIASTATFERNIIRNVDRLPPPAPQPGFGFAIQVQNGFSTSSSWDVIIRNNRIYDNLIGLFVVGNQSTTSETNVLTMRNVITTNKVGMVVVSGFDGPGKAGTGNDFQVISQEDRIVDNVGAPFLSLGGGVVAIAGSNDFPDPVPASNGNRLRLQLLQTEFSGNLQGSDPRDLSVFGYLTNRPRSSPGENNQLRLLVRRADGEYQAGAFVMSDNRAPATSGPDNKVIMIGSNVAFETTNEVFNAPDDSPPFQP